MKTPASVNLVSSSVEWFAKLRFPNFQNSNEIVEVVRREFRIDKRGKIKGTGLRQLADEALSLPRQMEGNMRGFIWLCSTKLIVAAYMLAQ